MTSVEKVSKLLVAWERENADPTATLTTLAELFESETEAFLKKDPDPFDDRHPSRSQPDCVLGHMLKTIFKNERIVDEMVKVYCQRDCVDLNIAVCRVLLAILPGLENVVFQEVSFILRLLQWAEHAPNPLQSYATGLLAAAMNVQEIAANYREKNAYFVPLMLKRLRDISGTYLKPRHLLKVNSDRPFAHLNNESEAPFVEPNHAAKETPKSTKKREKHTKLRNNKRAKVDLPLSPDYKGGTNESSNSWCEMEQYVIGSCKVHPLTPAVQQRYILQYLTPMGEYSELIGYVLEADAVPLILQFIDLNRHTDVRLAFEALKYLASLLCHKKIAIDFINNGRYLQMLLDVKRPSIAATGVSLCLYYFAYIQEAMERICMLPVNEVSNLVSYALWLLECSHDSGRVHATMFFGFAFSFRLVLELFDKQDGLRKLFNVMGTLDVYVQDNIDMTLSEDQIFGDWQTTKHVCAALKKYFEAHLAKEAEDRSLSLYHLQSWDNSNSEKLLCSDSPHIKYNADKGRKTAQALCYTYESVQQDIETLIKLESVPVANWKAVDAFLNLDGVSFFLGLLSTHFEISYSGKSETVKSVLDVLKICSLTARAQHVFCDKISNIVDHQNATGMSFVLKAVRGEDFPEPDIQRAALQIIINCVCPEICALQVDRNYSKKKSRNDELLNKLWKCVRTSNGIMVLIDLVSVKTPITDADSLRALACKALCGMARSETVKQIIGKLPLMSNGKLLALLKEPILQDRGQEHVKFCKYGLKLIQRVTGAPVTAGTESSILTINKAEVVAKTKVIYEESQLLQLISQHLYKMGFNETVSCLQNEMSKLSMSSNSSFTNSNQRTPFKPRSSMRSSLLSDRCNSFSETFSPNLDSSFTTIPPPSVPLKIILTKKTQNQQVKSSANRLQKPQTCSGNYIQSPAMKHQAASSSYFVPPNSITLDNIVTEYLRKQHALCKNPMLVCPSFDLFVPHKCPEPHYKRNASINSVLRIQKREASFHNGGYGGPTLNRKHIFSKFRPVRTLRDSEGMNDFTYCSFLNYASGQHHTRIFCGRSSGEVKLYNVNTGEEEMSHNCHNSDIAYIECSKSSKLVITCGASRRGNSSLWNFTGNSFELLNNFSDFSHMEFGKRNMDRLVCTKYDSAVIFDASTFAEMQTFSSQDLGNNYSRNRATFDFNDELILSDGMIWDVRTSRMIHKLDKLNANHNGVFHPNGREIISNSEIWDLRSFKLLSTVSTLDQCQIIFNPSGDVIYGVSCEEDSKMPDDKIRSFCTVDALDYSSIATIDIKKAVYQLSADKYDRFIGIIEKQASTSDYNFGNAVPGMDCVCRLYEVGRTKIEDDEDGEESDDEDSDEETDADEDDDNDLSLDDTMNDISVDADESFLEDGSASWVSTSDSDDDRLFSLNASQDNFDTD